MTKNDSYTKLLATAEGALANLEQGLTDHRNALDSWARHVSREHHRAVTENEARLAQARDELDTRSACVSAAEAAHKKAVAALQKRAAEVDAKAASLEKLDAKLEQRLAELKAELVKWMFLFWLGTVATMLGLGRALLGG